LLYQSALRGRQQTLARLSFHLFKLDFPFLAPWRRGRQLQKADGPDLLDRDDEKVRNLEPVKTSPPNTMHSFDFVCIGAGGGPSETDLSSFVYSQLYALRLQADPHTLLHSSRYLVKASDARWEDGIIALEAGSGIGALGNILARSRDVFHDVKPIPNTQEPPQILACRIYSYIQ
jgi:hypothetical protein